jgi:hypothetical protein
VVVELAVVVVVAVVVEVDVAVAGGVPFGHPCHPKMSNIILITLSDKVKVLKKKNILSIISCYCTLRTSVFKIHLFVMVS